MLEGLCKVADVALYVLIPMEREGYDGLLVLSAIIAPGFGDCGTCRCRETYDEAECEPRVGFDDACAVVAAVEALAYDALVALNFPPESMLAACEYQAHLGSAGDCFLGPSGELQEPRRCSPGSGVRSVWSTIGVMKIKG